jgi:hypothetical protein
MIGERKVYIYRKWERGRTREIKREREDNYDDKIDSPLDN